jgi:hypothetical protein
MRDEITGATMDEREFLTSQQAEEFLLQRLRADDNERSALVQIAGETDLIERHAIRGTAPPGGAPTMITKFRWVIRDDDLALFESFFDGARLSASAGFFVAVGTPDAAFWGALIGLTATLFKLLRNVVNKSRALDASTFAVLLAVKGSNGITSEVIADRLQRPHEEIVSTLDKLKSLPMNDGNPKQLVAKNQHGQWVAAGF